MHDSTPITIKKHWFGLFVIALTGLATTTLLAIALATIQAQGQLTSEVASLAAIGLVATLLGTIVASYVYTLSKIYLTDHSLNVTSWGSLFQSTVAITEWVEIEDVTITKAGLFGMTLDYGTLLVQTAGTEGNIVLTMVPNVEYWRDYIASRVAQALPATK